MLVAGASLLRKKEDMPMPRTLSEKLRACVATLAAENANASKDEEGASASRQDIKEEETPVINE